MTASATPLATNYSRQVCYDLDHGRLHRERVANGSNIPASVSSVNGAFGLYDEVERIVASDYDRAGLACAGLIGK
jgi:hypothetical protein